MGIFIPHRDIANLKKYKYQSEDKSIITKLVLKPFWIQFAKIFPSWLAPNVVTLTGLVFILINLVIVFYQDPTLNTPSPRWCYVSYAFGLFMYQTFDACDGIQARKTGQSGPLGELFDHCVDAINTSLSTIIFASVFQLGWGWQLFFSQFATLANFYLSTWEEYHTHILYLSVCSGPVEGILIIIGTFLWTAYYGPHFWQQHLFNLNLSSIGLDNEFPVTITEVFIVLAGLGLYFNVDTARDNVNKLIPLNKKSKALAGLIPFVTFYTSVFMELLVFPEILPNYAFPFYMTIASAMAFAVGRIIVGHLTLQKFPMINPPMLIPLAEIILIKILVHVFGFSRESVVGSVVYSGFGISVGIHGVFIIEIIYEITSYLDIYALSIKHPKQGKNN